MTDFLNAMIKTFLFHYSPEFLDHTHKYFYKKETLYHKVYVCSLVHCNWILLWTDISSTYSCFHCIYI